MAAPVKTTPSADDGRPSRRPTQADVARRAGVSTATVSHILSGRSDRKGSGNAETRRRVERAMTELGYRTNWAGRALRRQRTGLVGLVAEIPGSPWSARIVSMARTEFARHSLDVVILPVEDGSNSALAVRDILDRRIVDACVVLTLDHENLGALAGVEIPIIVFVDDGPPGIAAVRHHYADAAREATARIAERGVRRFLLVEDDSADPRHGSRNIFDPVRSVLASFPDAPDPAFIHVPIGLVDDLSRLPWDELAAAGPHDPVAIMCLSDRIAIAISLECRRRGIDLGRSVGVVGRGNLPEGADLPVPISTMGQETLDYSTVFAEVAEASVRGDALEGDWSFPWSFIERESTAGLRAER